MKFKIMGLIDIFKKKPEKKARVEKEEKKEEKKEIREEKIQEKIKSEPKVEKKAEIIPQKQKNEKISGEMAWILKSPQISEKAGYLAEKNQYIFKISPRANKTDVKKATEGIFGVSVSSVRIINIPKKERRVGGKIGFKKGYKKAIVKIKQGQKIEVLPR